MSDKHRYMSVKANPDTEYRKHDGAPAVDLVLSIADRWLSRRAEAERRRPVNGAPRPLYAYARVRLPVILLLGVCALALTATLSFARAF